jgi:1-acyl-sn-glycerol-3-phosphate acyltransferase
MRALLHLLANQIARLFMILLFGCVSRVRFLHRENAHRNGGFLLACNHISHFDPFIISSIVRRKIDWMAMAEFFPYPLVGWLLRAVDAFPAQRDRADTKTIRTAIARLQRGRVVGIFPEGGIRDGARSVLEGAPLRAGASTLASMAKVPIVPCVIIGSDRFYAKANWVPLRRVPVWVAFGNPISYFPELEKSEARQRADRELAAAFQTLYAEVRERFCLGPDDLPHPPRQRMAARRAALHSS